MNDTLKVGFIGFCYVLILGLLLQLFIIPATSLHAGDGLLKGGDWIAFHQIAIELAEKIEQNGWHMWRLRPEGQAPAGVAALLYVITGIYQPWILLPVNAILFAVSAACLHLILSVFTVSRNKTLLATLPLFLLPSLAIVWGQFHKDIWVLAGLFLVLVFWSRMIAMGPLGIFEILICVVGGNCLIFLVRPYALKILLLSQLLVFILLIFNSSIVKSLKLFLQGALALFFTLFVIYATKTMNQEIPGAEDVSRYACAQWRYTLSNAFIDEAFSRLSCYREMWIEKSAFAASNVDADIHFEAASDVIAYIPRAVQVGMLAPFPNSWSGLDISDINPDCLNYLVLLRLFFYMPLMQCLLSCFSTHKL